MRPLFFSLLFLFAGCTSTDTVSVAAGSSSLDSRLYDLSSTDIPAQHADVLARAIRRADSLSTSQPFLDAIRAKEEWSFTPGDLDGTRVAEVIERGEHADTNERVRPRLSFYTSPSVGRDICGGVNIWIFKRTKSTGCTLPDGSIHRNLKSMPSDHKVLAAFLLHEWMHAAGFGHNGNRNQCSQTKRNSVPIYVGCLSQAHPDSGNVDGCSLSCSAAQ